MRACARILLACIVVGAAAWLCLDLRVWHGPAHAWLTQPKETAFVAEVEDMRITSQELAAALREHLWKRGESWPALDAAAQGHARQEALGKLIDARLIHRERLRENGPPSRTVEAQVRTESEILRGQFTSPEEGQGRLAGQGHSQRSFEGVIREQLLDEAWLLAKAKGFQTTGTEAEMKAWHNSFKEKLRIPAAHHVAHLFLAYGDGGKTAREPEIRRIYQEVLQNPQRFAALVQQYSEDARTKAAGGDLGWVTRQRTPADFMAAVEKTEVGRISAPVTTKLGWHLIRVLEQRPARVPAFAEVRSEIAAYLTTQQREEAVAKVLAELRRQAQPCIKVHAERLNTVVPAP